jgi:hypothetical protein
MTAPTIDELAKLALNVLAHQKKYFKTRDDPRSGQREPDDPGAAVWFDWGARPYVFACDTYLRVADNVAALAAHIDSVRTSERHGVAELEQAFQGFLALPAARGGRSWREVLGFAPEWPTAADRAAAVAWIEARFKERAVRAHPDAGGSTEAMAELNAARAQARKEFE